MEYLIVLRGGRGQQFIYELAYRGEGDAGEKFLLGLIDSEKPVSPSPEEPTVN